MSKYEPSLYTNVEEMAASMGQTTAFENLEISLEDKTAKDSEIPNRDSRL